jgi:hypothetical protein
MRECRRLEIAFLAVLLAGCGRYKSAENPKAIEPNPSKSALGDVLRSVFESQRETALGEKSQQFDIRAAAREADLRAAEAQLAAADAAARAAEAAAAKRKGEEPAPAPEATEAARIVELSREAAAKMAQLAALKKEQAARTAEAARRADEAQSAERKRITQVAGNVAEIVKKDCQKYVEGQLLFQPSQTMHQGQTYLLFARLSRAPGVNITQGLEGTEFEIVKERVACKVSIAWMRKNLARSSSKKCQLEGKTISFSNPTHSASGPGMLLRESTVLYICFCMSLQCCMWMG